jgi:adenine specific DNA methylase Mod|tara:strand:+ start:520 stop:804 length:285 start_codon:yes stop_codon:yes gene_type:complete
MNKDEKRHLRNVADLGCIACRKLGYYGTPAEIHHIKNKTLGKKSSHYDTIPLCPYHHRTSTESIHINPKWFEQKFGTEKELLDEVLELLINVES